MDGSWKHPYWTSTLQLVVVGLNHSTAPLAVRERVAFVGCRSGDALAHLASEVDEGFILSTCNRSEVYALTGHAESGIRLVTGFIERWHGIDAGALAPHVYSHTHAAAVRHFFRVVSGLDSMVLGEDQIVGQARSALAKAKAAGSLGSRLHRLGAAALAVSKRVRSDTGLCRSPLSVVSIALSAAADDLGGLAGQSVVVVGAGRTAASVLKLLRSLAPSATVTLVNRTASHAVRLGARHGAYTAEWSELAHHIAAADVLISATSAPCVVIGTPEVRAAAGRGRALVCLDLAVPRDIDPAVAALPGISIHHVDDLRQRAAANRGRREAEIGPAEAIVEDGVARFAEWWRAREVVPVISRLRARADAIREAEVQRALARLPHADSASETVIRTLAGRLVNKLLHEPLTNVKEDPEGGNLAIALDRLFTPRAASSDPSVPRSGLSVESIAS